MLQLGVHFGTKYLMILERRKENKAASRWVLLEAFPTSCVLPISINTLTNETIIYLFDGHNDNTHTDHANVLTSSLLAIRII